MKNDPSRDQLSKSIERRIKHLMIRTLEKFEDVFDDLDGTREAGIFKSDIRTAFNDVIRAQRDEIRDYEVDYRPLKLRDDSILSVTQTFMETLERIELGFRDQPYVKIYANFENKRVIDALRAEISTGILFNEDNSIVLEIVGINSCVNCVLPILDRYRLHSSVREEYGEWRNRVCDQYRR